jgi:hypothetical protein
LREALNANDQALTLLVQEPSDEYYAEARFTKGRSYDTLGAGDPATSRQALVE